jgi:hypothetical protein
VFGVRKRMKDGKTNTRFKYGLIEHGGMRQWAIGEMGVEILDLLIEN